MPNKNPKAIKTYILSDSWSWCWFPSMEIDPDSEDLFTSSRHCYFGDHYSQNSFPILKVLLESQGHDTVMLGQPGSSNMQQVERLNTQILYESHTHFKKPDVTIFLQTDPLRDLIKDCDQVYNDDIEPDVRAVQRIGLNQFTVNQFEDLVDTLLLEAYVALFSAHIDYELSDVPILILGGCGSVRPKIVKKASKITGFTNAHIVSENLLSDINHIITGMPKIDFHPCYMNRIESCIDHTWNPELVDYIYEKSWFTYSDNNAHIHNYVFPDHSHLNASSMIVVVEMINQYLDKLDI